MNEADFGRYTRTDNYIFHCRLLNNQGMPVRRYLPKRLKKLKTDRVVEKQTERRLEKGIERQTDIQMVGKTTRQKDRQKNKHTNEALLSNVFVVFLASGHQGPTLLVTDRRSLLLSRGDVFGFIESEWAISWSDLEKPPYKVNGVDEQSE